MFERLITEDRVIPLPPPAQPRVAAHSASAPLRDHRIAQFHTVLISQFLLSLLL